MGVKADEVLSQHSTETKVYTMDFTPKLRRSSFQGAIAETLTGSTPSVTELTSTITPTGAAVNTVPIVREKREGDLVPYDEEIPIGAAVQFRVPAGATAGKYTFRATCASSSPDSNTHVVEGELEIE